MAVQTTRRSPRLYTQCNCLSIRNPLASVETDIHKPSKYSHPALQLEGYSVDIHQGEHDLHSTPSHNQGKLQQVPQGVWMCFQTAPFS